MEAVIFTLIGRRKEALVAESAEFQPFDLHALSRSIHNYPNVWRQTKVMDFIKFFYDFILVTLTTALVLVPHALDTHCTLREQKKAKQAEG
jgi:hypothetical protein